MIDIHSHIAWNVDDGFSSEEESASSLMKASQDGIQAIVSTPHFVPGQIDQELFDRITFRQKELKELAQESNVEIYYGAEMFMNRDFPIALQEGWYRTINGSKYLLVEYDVTRDIHSIQDHEEFLYEVTIHNMVPVIAHVERYFYDGVDKKLVKKWFEQGFVLQVNRTSILGLEGKQMQKNALWLLDQGLVHVVSSDAHRDHGRRKEILSDVYTVLINRYGQEGADLLLKKNPSYLLENKKVLNMEKKKRGWFSWLG